MTLPLPELTAEQMRAYLGEVGERLQVKGVTGEIVLAGGAVMVMTLHARGGSRDIDAVFVRARGVARQPRESRRPRPAGRLAQRPRRGFVAPDAPTVDLFDVPGLTRPHGAPRLSLLHEGVGGRPDRPARPRAIAKALDVQVSARRTTSCDATRRANYRAASRSSSRACSNDHRVPSADDGRHDGPDRSRGRSVDRLPRLPRGLDVSARVVGPTLSRDARPFGTRTQRRWAALLAASIEELCARDGLAPPAWTHTAVFRFDEPWYLYEGSRANAGVAPRDDTAAFARRNIWSGNRVLRRT